MRRLLRSRWTGLALGAALIALQDPSLLIEPRIRAEEGALFLARAFSGIPLFDLRWGEVGYLDPVPIVAGVLAARCLPLEQAPWVFLVLAFLAQMAPIIVLSASRARLFATPERRLLGILFLTIGVPQEEIWLCTLGSKFHLASIAVLLALDLMDPAGAPPGRGSRSWRLAVLAATPLFAIQAAFLVPAFAVAALAARTRAAWGPTLALAAGAAVQVLMGATTKDASALELAAESRFDIERTLRSGAHVVNDLLLAPLLGRTETTVLARGALRGLVDLGMTPALAHLAISLLGVLVVALLLVPRSPAGWLLALGVVSTIAGSAAFQISILAMPLDRPRLALRYLIAPAFMFAALLWDTASWPALGAGRIRRGVAILLLAAVLAAGAWIWISRPVEISQRPRWSEEVAHWRADPEYTPRVVPPPWHVILVEEGQIHAQARHVPIPGALAELACALPRLGEPVQIRISGAPPGAAGTLFLQLGRAREDPDATSGTLLPESDRPPVVLPVQCDEEGSWQCEVPLSRSIFYAGHFMTLQAVFTTPLRGFSTAMEVRLGF
jgi:hypothetical protein